MPRRTVERPLTALVVTVVVGVVGGQDDGTVTVVRASALSCKRRIYGMSFDMGLLDTIVKQDESTVFAKGRLISPQHKAACMQRAPL